LGKNGVHPRRENRGYAYDEPNPHFPQLHAAAHRIDGQVYIASFTRDCTTVSTYYSCTMSSSYVLLCEKRHTFNVY